VTNVRGPSAYVRHSDHTVTEVSQSHVPQRSSHHTNLQLRTGLTLCRRIVRGFLGNGCKPQDSCGLIGSWGVDDWWPVLEVTRLATRTTGSRLWAQRRTRRDESSGAPGKVVCYLWLVAAVA